MCVSGFRELYENEQLFDVILSVGGKEFHGHKSLLAASSDYFRAMFTTELAEKDKKVWFWLEDEGKLCNHTLFLLFQLLSVSL